jgi:hypothetical protein
MVTLIRFAVIARSDSDQAIHASINEQAVKWIAPLRSQ